MNSVVKSILRLLPRGSSSAWNFQVIGLSTTANIFLLLHAHHCKPAIPQTENDYCGERRQKGGALTELDVYLPHRKPQIVRTDEDTIALLCRLAAYYPDAVIAGRRQGRETYIRGNRRKNCRNSIGQPRSARAARCVYHAQG